MARPITKEQELFGDLYIELMGMGLRVFPVEEKGYKGVYAVDTAKGHLLFKVVAEYPETPYQALFSDLSSLPLMTMEEFLGLVEYVYMESGTKH